jgi:membrane-associated phospholipid phosphatase
MYIYFRRFNRLFFLMEFHEILSLFMICFLVVLYGLGSQQSLLDASIHLAFSAGLIPKVIIILLILFYIMNFLIPNTSAFSNIKSLIRNIASFFVMLFSFEAVTHYIIVNGLELQDTLLQQVDNAVFFGKQPAVWMESINSKQLDFFFSVSYLSWFFLTYGSILLMWRYGKKALLEYTSTALLTFYIGYMFYILVPAVGPLYTYPFSKPLSGLTVLMSNSDIFTPAPDAFPSLHTGISIVMLILIWRYCKKWTWFYLPLIASIIISTMYLRIHYGIDVIAGIVLSIIISRISPAILLYWQKKREDSKIGITVIPGPVNM